MWILRAPVRITLLLQGPKLRPQGTCKGMNMGNVWWAKNINDFDVNFARTCRDHILATRIQVGTSRDSQRNENWKCLIGKKTQTTFMWILRAPVRITILPQGSKLGPQGATKGMIIEDVWLVKNINEVHTIPLWRHFLHQDHGKSHLVKEGLILKAENCK